MSRLGKMIDAAADGAESVTGLLRQVKVLASRIGATELSDWASTELRGYGIDEDVPAYRGPLKLPVLGTWSGPFGSSISRSPVSAVGVAEDFRSTWFELTIRQPIAELEPMASGDGDGEPGVMWDPYAITAYNKMVESRQGGMGFEMMSLVHARIVMPRTAVAGILDAVRNQVLDLVLALERVSPEIGELDGPTTNDARVGEITQQFNFTIYGDGANIATGNKVRQVSTVVKGDTDALTVAAREAGLTAEGAEQFREAVLADGREVGEQTRGFVARVKTGTVALASNVSANVVASALMQAAVQYFGG